MPFAPQETDSSGSVVQSAFEIITNVEGEEETEKLAARARAERTGLKENMRERQDRTDDVSVAKGRLGARERHTKRELDTFSSRLAGHLATPKLAGNKHETYLFVFDEAPPSKLLPSREHRAEAITKLKDRVTGKKVTPAIRELAKDLVKAIDNELAAVKALAGEGARLQEAVEKEEKAKVRTVVAVRKLIADVTGLHAESPAEAREILGYATPKGGKAKGEQKAAGSASRTPGPVASGRAGAAGDAATPSADVAAPSPASAAPPEAKAKA